MPDLYDGPADGRQLPVQDMQLVTRFRPRYRQLSPEEVKLHDELKAAAVVLEQIIEQIKPGRYRSLAFTDLESAVMWAVKELTG